MLIWLAKAGKLNLLREQYTKILIPQNVYDEVVEEGLREGYADAYAVKEAVEQGWIIVEADTGNQKKRLTDDLPDIHEGEAAAMLIARDKNLPILIDESSGRAIAEALGLAPRGTIYVVLKALFRGRLTSTEARDTISSMVSSGFRIDPNLLERVLREISLF